VKFGWKGALGVVVSAVCLYFAFKGFDWSRATAQAKHANLLLLLASTATATCMFPLRARRWRTILDPVAYHLPFGPLWRATAIGVMMTNLLPARAGEIVRPYALSRERPEVPFSAALASVAVDRVFDAIVVLLLLGLSMLSTDFPATITIQEKTWHIALLARKFAFAPIVLLVGLYALVFFPDALIRVFESFARRVSRRLEEKGSEMLRRFAEGLSVLRHPTRFLAVFLWTLLHWLVQPLAFWLGLRAFGIDASWAALLFMQGVIVLAVAVPSSPGFIGIFEASAAASLAAYGIDSNSALTWAIVFHLFSYIPITLFGAYYFARAGIHMGDVESATRNSSPT
jgi:glycosyltransferase 2 family protein